MGLGAWTRLSRRGVKLVQKFLRERRGQFLLEWFSGLEGPPCANRPALSSSPTPRRSRDSWLIEGSWKGREALRFSAPIKAQIPLGLRFSRCQEIREAKSNARGKEFRVRSIVNHIARDNLNRLVVVANKNGSCEM